jgi:alkylated DNA nucleotide flippase Atl1
MDVERVRAVVAAIPRGRWMSYADVVVAAGEHPAAARRLNQYLIREDPPGAHRVLKGDGSIADNALGAPVTVRQQLESEGVPFEDDRAPADRRVREKDLKKRRARRAKAKPAGGAKPKRAGTAARSKPTRTAA